MNKQALDRSVINFNEYRDKLLKEIYSIHLIVGEKWFSALEYLIIVGLLKILAEKLKDPEKLIVNIIYSISYVIWFFYCLGIVVTVLNKNYVSRTWALVAGAVMGLLLNYFLSNIAVEIAGKPTAPQSSPHASPQ